MALDRALLEILVCPENKTRLTVAEPALVEKLNAAIDKRRLFDRRGTAIEERVDGALVREDQKIAYAVRDDIPDLIVDEGIPMEQV